MNAHTLHLRVFQNVVAEDREPSQLAALCNLQRTEVVWNDTFTAFRLVALHWWDDTSYSTYQARDIEDDGSDEDQRFEAAAKTHGSGPPSLPPSNDPDDILF